jgi:homocysteine S-methyltransferase
MDHGVSKSEDAALTLIGQAVELAKRARDITNPHGIVAASIGPYGAFLANGAEYTGDYGDASNEKISSFHSGRINALALADPDVILLETMPRADEVAIVLQLLSEVAPHIPVWVSLSVLESGHLADGTSLGVVMSMLTMQVEAVGVNCLPLTRVEPALEVLKSNTHLPLIAYPNSGEKYNAETKTWNSPKDPSVDSPSRFLADALPIWHELGARIIGGCCRTTPQDISVLANAAKALAVDLP